MSVAMPAVDEHNPANNESFDSFAPSGRLRDSGLTETERNFSLAIHLSPFSFLLGLGPLAFFIPLVLWLIRKDHSAFNDDHGREMINFLISYFLFGVLLVWTIVVPITLMVVGVINMIRGSIASANGEYFRYPMTIRFLT